MGVIGTKISYDLNEKNLKEMKRLENLVYANTCYRGMQSYSTWDGIASYCCCSKDQVRLMMGKGWYVLFAEYPDYLEVVDLCSSTHKAPIFKIIDQLHSFGKAISLDARENTSYRILTAMAKRGRVEMFKDETWTWGGENFHEIVLAASDNPDLEALREKYQAMNSEDLSEEGVGL